MHPASWASIELTSAGIPAQGEEPANPVLVLYSSLFQAPAVLSDELRRHKMGSVPESFCSDLIDDDVLPDASRRLSMVAEEDANARASDTSPGEDQEDDSSEHSPRQRSSKRQRTGFSCEACHTTFTEKRALARHKKTDHHRKQLGLPPDRKHVCDLCHKYFTRGHDLKRHQNEQHTDILTNTHSVPTRTSSASSEVSPEQPSDNSSSIRSVSQASNATDNTSLHTLAEPTHGSMGTLSDSSEAKFEYLPMGVEEEGHNVLRHIKSEPNLDFGNATSRKHARRTSDLSDVMDEDEFEKPYVASDCGRDALSDDLDQMPASARQLPVTYPADAGLLAQLPTQPFDIHSWQTTMCPLCNDAFEDDSDELLRHLRRHLDNFQGKCRCTQCHIDFVHEEDLQRHLQSAARGHCGFSFPHFCTGHHPPWVTDRSDPLSDYDRMRFFVQLQHWEQTQLQAYIAYIGELTASRETRRLTRWSEVIQRGSSRRDSFASFAISVNSLATVPCDVSGGKTDIGGLQKRLQLMSLGNAGSKVRRLIHPGSSDVRSRTIDRSLRKAIKHDDTTNVEKLLEMGADASIIHNCEGPFIAMALWAQGNISPHLNTHRVEEDLAGSCSLCGIGTASFEKGFHKVEALLRHQANPNQPGGLCGYPLATAAWMGRMELVRLLLHSGANIRQMRGKYGSALCAAASQTGYEGHLNVIRYLLRKGAEVHARGPEGTALELAKKRRDFWVMKLMSMSSQDDEIRGRIPCCDEVIEILEKEENKPFKRSATPALGGIEKERTRPASSSSTTPNPSKLSFATNRHPGLKLMKSFMV